MNQGNTRLNDATARERTCLTQKREPRGSLKEKAYTTFRCYFFLYCNGDTPNWLLNVLLK